MGYAVLHIDKARSNDSGNTAHIARTYTPSNVDPSRTRLNRELVAGYSIRKYGEMNH